MMPTKCVDNASDRKCQTGTRPQKLNLWQPHFLGFSCHKHRGTTRARQNKLR